jgi:hypothetical protein
MANYNGPTEGGAGGKRGHSSMEHWTRTEDIKESTKVRRRQEGRRYSREGIDDMLDDEMNNKTKGSGENEEK